MSATDHRHLSGAGLFAAGSAAGLGVVVLLGAMLGVVVAVVVGQWEPVERFDVAVVEALSIGSDATLLQRVIGIVTELGGSAFTWTVFAVTTLFLAIRGLPRLATYVAVTGIGAQILSVGVKALVGRARPVVDVAVEPVGGSFPSGHTLGATVTFGMLLLVFLPAVQRRHRSWVVAGGVAIVGVVGITRVVLGVHFPTDVIGGWLLGALWLGVTAAAFHHWVAGEAGLVPGRIVGSRDGQLRLTPTDDHPLAGGARTVTVLVVGAVLIFGALYGLGLLVTGELAVVQRFDARVVAWFVTIRTDWLSTVAIGVGYLGSTGGVLIGLAVAAAVAAATLRLRRPVVFLVVVVSGETLLFLATATLVDRTRPGVEQLSQALPPTSSFPSGHVAAATALHVAVALLVLAWSRLPWLRGVAVTWAVAVPLLVAFSRLYRGVHHPTDVVVSILYASAWVAVCWTALQPRPESEPAAPVPERSAAGR